MELIKLGQGKNIKERNRNAIDEFVRRAYENLCITYLESLNSANRLEKFHLEFKRFSADNTSIGRSVEIDIIASEGDSLMIGECKFSKNKKGKKEYFDMVEDATIKPLNSYSNKYFYLFSHTGFEEVMLQTNYKNLHLITSLDMLHVDDFNSDSNLVRLKKNAKEMDETGGTIHDIDLDK